MHHNLLTTFILLLGLSSSFNSFAITSTAPVDPLQSSQWSTMHQVFLRELPVKFDSRVQVIAPDSAEDALQVPVAVKVSGIDNIQEILIFVDFNPLPKTLSLYPYQAEPFIGFRIKLQQASPVRAAVRTPDAWYVGGQWIETAGGGCTLPSATQANRTWETELGTVHARLWQSDRVPQRLRFRVIHPMDTGLANGIPVFFIEEIVLKDAQQQPVLKILPYEPVSENPIFSLDLPAELNTQQLSISGLDNNGNRFTAEVLP